jgi:hypothetical protein
MPNGTRFQLASGSASRALNGPTSGSVSIAKAETATITAGQLAGSPFYGLNSSISAQIAPMQAGSLNGTELTQMYVAAVSGSAYLEPVRYLYILDFC